MTKADFLKKLSTEEGFITALAIDQRGALRRMLGENATNKQLEDFKKLVSKHLTKYASAILLDPEVGFPAAQVRDANCGLLTAYEKTGYDKAAPGRFPDLVEDCSVRNLKERGAEAIKFLLYFDIDEPAEINDRKLVFIERVGAECKALDIPFFLEIVSYDEKVTDEFEFAKIKPRKVNEALKVFCDPRYGVDVLKLEVPVNMKFVEGFSKDGRVAYTREQALAYFKEQSDACTLPFIFLSAGVSAELFRQTLEFAAEAGSEFNGVLCGRATWAEGVEVYKNSGEAAAIEWLETQGRKNIEELNEVIVRTAKGLKL